MKFQISNKTENITEYFYEDETGDARITVYHLFPGLNVSYVSTHTSRIDFSSLKKEKQKKYIGFHYCKEGRIEQEAEGEFIYLMPGDCLVMVHDSGVRECYFPLKHYHGISIEIDPSVLEPKMAEYLEDKDVEPEKIVHYLCHKKQAVILRNKEALVHIFKESYHVNEEHKLSYLKIKVMELLFVIGTLNPHESEVEEIHISRSQAELVKKIASYISEHINEKLNLQNLTLEFGVSASHLQKIFQNVYGMTVASYIRVEKMQNAAQVLIHTERSIDDIAEEFGYSSEGKFSAAFKKIMGDTPSIFRKEHTKIKIYK